MGLLETDRVDLALDPLTGDLAVGADGGPYWIAGLDAIVQLCTIKMQQFAGEYFADLDRGIDYWGEILGQKPGISRARDEFSTALLEVPGVSQIVTLELEFDGLTRNLTVSWQVRTEFGDSDIETTEVG